MLAASDLPSAVMASNDRCALGVQDSLNRAGVRVPGSVSLVGHDDSALARLAHIDLTTVSQNAREQAAQAVAAVVERLDSGRATHREVVLNPRLVVRSTSGPPPSAGEGDVAVGSRSTR
jgi:DNA-binding LacI/PurR family transcriptional regulator